MQSSFAALSINTVFVFKSCMTLRGLGDKACHIMESHLQQLEDEGCSRPYNGTVLEMYGFSWLQLKVLCLW